MAYKAGLKARPLPWSIFTNFDPFRTNRFQTSEDSSEVVDAMTQVSPKSLVTEEDYEMSHKPRDSILSPQSSSDSTLSSAPTNVPSLTLSDEKPSSIDSDTLVDSAVVSPQNSDPVKSTSTDHQAEKTTPPPPPPPPFIFRTPKRPVITTSEKRVFSNTGSYPAATFTSTTASHYYRRSSSVRGQQPPKPNDPAYIIPTDKPATFPYLAHAYPLRNPGSEEEPMMSAMYVELPRSDFVVPVVTIVQQGERDWWVRARTVMDGQGPDVLRGSDMRAKQARFVERFCVWESVPPSVGE